jgi:uncharacterized protein YecT (DUF1311 family)
MKRQLGVWITIICILVVGVSVTKMTRRFVTSGTLETFAAETTVVFEPSAMARTATGAAGAESPRSRQAETELFSAAAETAAEAKVSEAPEEEMAAENMAVITEASEVTPEQEALTSETVKSPLDPGPAPAFSPAMAEAADGGALNPSENFRERLDSTAEQIERSKEAANSSAQAAAEYEWTLWDNELNTIYSAIRRNMDEAEKEALKQEELEWIRTRDAAAERAAGKNNVQTNRNTAYILELSEMTKERCYELVDTYASVLDRDISQ